MSQSYGKSAVASIDLASDAEDSFRKSGLCQQEDLIPFIPGESCEPDTVGPSVVIGLEMLNRAADQFGHFFFESH
jgi:hypothetical protein